MGSQPRTVKHATIAKALVSVIVLALSVNVASAHVSIGIGVGPVYAAPPAYYAAPPVYYGPPAPVYYGPPPAVTWVPDHWEYGYWVPGHYVEYNTPAAPGPGYVWIQGGWDHHHHWHRGYWRQ